MAKKLYITTSIPYVNADPHVGHAQEYVIADTLARLFRKQGCNVVFQTGTDENALKNVLAAEQAGLPVETFIEKKAGVFRRLLEELNISNTHFVRTTEERHKQGVIKFWKRLNPNDLYESFYRGLYCVGCEDFFLEKDLVSGLCPDHKQAPIALEEKNIFFRLSRYTDPLLELIQNRTINIEPAERRNEVIAFIRQGLHDISITRSKSRSGGWGISLNEHQDQVVYVWIDALINYLSGQGYGTEDEAWKNVWSEDVRKIHVIGKNVWKFHAVYWPALLLSAGLPLPNDIVVHGFLTLNGVKISKSLGNVIDPVSLAGGFGCDALRHYLLHSIPTFSGGDFSELRLKDSYNNELANKLGNLYSRLITLADRAFGENVVPQQSLDTYNNVASLVGSNYNLQKLYQTLWNEIDEINAQINCAKPWELLKRGQNELAKNLIGEWLRKLCNLSFWLEAFLPNSASKIHSSLLQGKFEERILFPRR